MGDPVSRVAGCFAEGPENPRSAACKAAVAAGGTQALYDWNGVNIANAAGKSKEIIPDGKLCSAGNDKFKGLDLARADWPATGCARPDTFRYHVTAPHKGTFELYVTKEGYDPTQPLSWSDLDLEDPFATSPTRWRRAASTPSPAPCRNVPADSSCTRSGSARTARRRSTRAPT